MSAQTLPRLQLVELEDLPRFPAILRDLSTDYLEWAQERFRTHLAAVPLVSRALEEAGTDRIVDLCSGGGGPIVATIALSAHTVLPISDW